MTVLLDGVPAMLKRGALPARPHRALKRQMMVAATAFACIVFLVKCSGALFKEVTEKWPSCKAACPALP